MIFHIPSNLVVDSCPHLLRAAQLLISRKSGGVCTGAGPFHDDRTASPIVWHVRRQAVLARIVPRCLLCCVPLPQVETAMKTSLQGREEPMDLLRVAAPSRQAEEAVCHRRR